MSFNEQLLEAMTKYVQSRTDEKVVEVHSYESGLKTGGYCETCSYSYIVVEIYYKVEEGHGREAGRLRMMTYDGDFADFIETLSELD